MPLPVALHTSVTGGLVGPTGGLVCGVSAGGSLDARTSAVDCTAGKSQPTRSAPASKQPAELHAMPDVEPFDGTRVHVSPASLVSKDA